MKSWLYIFIAALLPVLLISCLSSAPNDESASTGGTGSEVVGVVNYPDSQNGVKKSMSSYVYSPLKAGSVFIHPESYYAETDKTSDIPVAYTAFNGFFRISNVLPGVHIVYISDGAGNAIAQRIYVPGRDTSIDLGLLTARKTASAQIQYQGVKAGNILFYVSVRGTGITAGCSDRNIYAVLGNIPTGLDSYTITVRMLQPFSGGKDFTIPNLNPSQLFTLDPFTDF